MGVDLTNASYVPTVFLKPAELLAVSELADTDKDLLCPVFCLRPWLASNQLEKSLETIEKAYGSRAFFLEIDIYYRRDGEARPAQVDFLKLKSDQNNNAEWIQFVRERPLISPCVFSHHGVESAISAQISAFTALERTFLIRLARPTIENQNYKIEVGKLIEIGCQIQHSNFGFIVDVGWSNDLIAQEMWADAVIRAIVARRGDAVPIILSGSSFPDNFVKYSGHGSISMQERDLFARLKKVNNNAKLIYGDWASARVPSERNGGGEVPPRIDLATNNTWEVFRYTEADGGYPAAAKTAMKNKSFASVANSWAAYMVQATALGGGGGISSTMRAAAVRINAHLIRQLYSNLDSPPLGSDEPYSD
jgi:hypothetical protein